MQTPVFTKYASPDWLRTILGKKEEPSYLAPTLTGAGIGTGVGAGGLLGTKYMHDKSLKEQDYLANYLKAFKSEDAIREEQLFALRDLSRKQDTTPLEVLRAEFDAVIAKANNMLNHRASKAAELEALPGMVKKWGGRGKFMASLLPILAGLGAGAGALREKRADFLERITALRNKDLHDRANKDMVMSSIPIFGEAAQFMSDIKHYGPATAADRAAYIQYHPAHFAAGPLSALLGAASAPLLAKFPAVRKLYSPINKMLLGSGPHRIAPSLGIGLANTAALGLLGNQVARGALSRNYTLKESSFKFSIPDSEQQQEEKRVRALTGLSPMAPLMASRLYSLNAPLYRDLDFVKNLDYANNNKVQARMLKALEDNNVALTSERFNRATGRIPSRVGASLGIDFGAIGDSSKNIRKPQERIGMLMRQLQATPGAYMDIDSTFAKALAANLYSNKEIKQLKGMILGGASETPLKDMFFGSSSTKPPALHVIAHEMGHAQQPKWMKSIPARFGLGAPLAAVAAPVLSDNENIGLGAAGLSTALAAPGLVGEFSASARGSNFLKNWLGQNNWSKLPALSKLSPFIGLPTYLAAASVPWVAYGTKKYLGGYDKK